MPEPKVSVCVPTYNGSAFLAQTLQSISNQTFQNYEVIVVDDHSQDDTVAIADRYAASDARVRVFRNQERAGSSARNANRCLSHARGEWIKFLFQDDLMAPTCLARMLEASATSRFVISWHDYLFAPDVDADVRAWYENLPSLRTKFQMTYVTAEDFCNAILKLWNINFIGPTSTSFIHRDCFTEYGPFSFEITTFPDLEYWVRIGSREGLAIVPEPLVSFRVHGNSISARMRESEALQYRIRLDCLVLLLNLAHAPEYEALRASAWTLRPPMDPHVALTRAAEYERWWAVDTRYRKRDDTFLKQWKAFCGKHPEILDVLRRADAQRSLLSRLKMFVKARL